MNKHETDGDGREIVTTQEHVDRLDFDEDQTLLRLLYNRIFRWAIVRDAELPEAPDIEKEAEEAVPELTDAMKDLDEARNGMTEVDALLAQWREEVVSGATQ